MDASDTAVRLPRVGIPSSVLSDPERFGGATRGELQCGTLVLQAGRAVRLEPEAGEDLPERILLPRLTEAHVHLDKCHSVDRCMGSGGDLSGALEAQRRDKAFWTRDDLLDRAQRGLQELEAAGCGTVRTHVDWGSAEGDPEVPLAWEVLGILAGRAAEQGMLVQRAALTGIDEMADADRAERVARRVAEGGGVLGGFVLDQSDRETGLRNLFSLAERFGLPLDFHVDEGLDPGLDGLELIADIALETDHAGPVLCGHACSLASRCADDVARIGDKLAAAGIAVAVLPATNLYLQGRRDGTPDRRGITRLRELAACGVGIVIGTDNVRDAFCPIGRHDPMHSLSLCVLAGHIDPPFGRLLPMITIAARRALGLPDMTVDGADARDLLAVPGHSLSDLVSGASAPRPLNAVLGVDHV
ncbi:MAG: amidohydrolase family protein [Rhodobacter sp.]|nr:amidohydrolase family protein [Rhodobacter sp.]